MPHLRPTNAAGAVVVTVSAHLHQNLPNFSGRACDVCQSVWKAEVVNGVPHAWRNGVQEDAAILDHVGNNLAIECC